MEDRRMLVWMLVLLLAWSGVRTASPQQQTDEASSKGRFSVLGALGHTAWLPCEVTPTSEGDEPTLVLWYKENMFGTPAYSSDLRNTSRGKHWFDQRVFGNRATFDIERTNLKAKTGAYIWKAALGIEQLRPDDEGPYRCRVDFLKAPTRNVKVKLDLIELPEKPVLLTANGSVTAERSPPMKINSSLVLTCNAHGGSPLPELFWWREDRLPGGSSGWQRRRLAASAASTFKDGVTVSSVRIDGLGRDDLGARIGCTANNTHIDVPPIESFTTIDMILSPVRVQLIREWGYFLAGKEYNVSCVVTGSNPQAYATATIGKKEIKVELQASSPSSSAAASTFAVRFVPTAHDRGALLACRAFNPHLPAEAAEDQWKIDVQYVPVTVLSPWRAAEATKTTEAGSNAAAVASIRVEEGDRVELRCAVDANPDAHHVHWRKDNALLQPGVSSGATPQPPFVLVRRDATSLRAVTTDINTLVLAEVTRADDGHYVCVAENLLGMGQSNAVHVKVLYRPVCRQSGPQLVLASLGETVSLSCRVSAAPDGGLRFEWSKDTHKESDGDDQDQGAGGGQSPGTLRYTLATESDFGVVSCWANNAIGRQLEPCTFEIRQRALPQIDSCRVKSSGLDWIAVGCRLAEAQAEAGLPRPQPEAAEAAEAETEAEAGQLQTKLSVFARLSGAGSSAESWSAESAAVSSTVDVTVHALSPGSRYALRAVASNSFGQSEPFHLEAVTFEDDDEEDEDDGAFVMVVVAASTEGAVKDSSASTVPINDPIRLLPIVGLMAVAVIFLVLIAVSIVVVIRRRGAAGRGADDSVEDDDSKTHIGFNRSLDFDLDHDDEDEDEDAGGSAGILQQEKEALRKAESPGKLDAYDKLSDVHFQGFYTAERIRRASSEKPLEVPPKRAQCLRACGGASKSVRLRSSVPVAALCDIDVDEEGGVLGHEGQRGRHLCGHADSLASGYHVVSEGEHARLHRTHSEQCVADSSDRFEDHFPFREAIPAPIPISRISQVLAIAAQTAAMYNQDTYHGHGSALPDVTLRPTVEDQASAQHERAKCKERVCEDCIL